MYYILIDTLITSSKIFKNHKKGKSTNISIIGVKNIVLININIYYTICLKGEVLDGNNKRHTIYRFTII